MKKTIKIKLKELPVLLSLIFIVTPIMLLEQLFDKIGNITILKFKKKTIK